MRCTTNGSLSWPVSVIAVSGLLRTVARLGQVVEQHHQQLDRDTCVRSLLTRRVAGGFV